MEASLLTSCSYHNGSILIATLQPTFTILHTLTTPRTPSPIAGLSWHGSSSKQKSEMLAAQSLDGDLRVWSVPKTAHSGDAPCVIRVLNKSDQRELGPCWFAWSKNGRIVQHTEGYVSDSALRSKFNPMHAHNPTGKPALGMYVLSEFRMRLFPQSRMS
jgi:WD40 repeat protein